MRNWHEVHVHCNNKNKEKEKQMLPPNKKILQIDIKHVGGSVIYFKEFKNPKKWGKPFIKWFFFKRKQIQCFSFVHFLPPPPISFKDYSVMFEGVKCDQKPSA